MYLHFRQQIRPQVNEQQVVWLAALLSVAAAAIHFAVSPPHFAEYPPFGWFFVVVAWLQVLWALGITSRRNRLLLVAGLIGNLAVAGIWLWTRLVGVPIGPEAGETETFGWPDGVTVGMELGIVFLSCLLLSANHRPRRSTSILLLAIVGSALLTLLIGLVLANDDGEAGHEATSPSLAPHSD